MNKKIGSFKHIVMTFVFAMAIIIAGIVVAPETASAACKHSGNKGTGSVTQYPTCTKAGYRYKRCTKCNYNYGSPYQYTGPLGHTGDSGNGTVTQTPNCTRAGYRYKRCTRSGCGANYGSPYKYREAYGHNVAGATCTTAPHCTRSGCTFTPPGSAALGHTGDKGTGTITRYPTCTQTGLRYKVCTRSGCGKQYGDPVVYHAALSHHVASATCTTAPHCTRSGCTFTPPDSKPLGHTGDKGTGTITRYPTCELTGLRYKVCTRSGCGKQYGDPVVYKDKLKHDMTGETCTTPSLCKRAGCNHYEGKALGHTGDKGTGKVTREASCELTGLRYKVCDRCGDQYGDPVVYKDKLKHDMTGETCKTPSLCKRAGCNHYEGKALGHTGDKGTGKVTREASCELTGLRYKVCDRCGDQYGDPVVYKDKLKHDMTGETCTTPSLCKREGCNHYEGKALGHDWADASCKAPKHCQRRGCSEKEGEALKHVWVEATCTTPKTCSLCGELDGKKKGHTKEYRILSEAKPGVPGTRQEYCIEGDYVGDVEPYEISKLEDILKDSAEFSKDAATLSRVYDEFSGSMTKNQLIGLMANIHAEGGLFDVVEYSFSKEGGHYYDKHNFRLPSGGSRIKTMADIEYLENQSWDMSSHIIGTNKDGSPRYCSPKSCGVGAVQWSFDRRKNFLKSLRNYASSDEDLSYNAFVSANLDYMGKELRGEVKDYGYLSIDEFYKKANNTGRYKDTAESWAEIFTDYYEVCYGSCKYEGTGSACIDRKGNATKLAQLMKDY